MNCYWKNVLNFVSILKRMEFLDLEHCTNWLLAFCNPKIHWFGFVRLAYLPQIIDSSWMRDPRYKHEYQCPLILSIEISWSCMYNPYALKACTQRKDCGLKQDLFSHFLYFFEKMEKTLFCHFTTLSWLLLFDFYEKNCKLLLQPEAESDAAALKMMLVCLLFFWGVEKTVSLKIHLTSNVNIRILPSVTWM